MAGRGRDHFEETLKPLLSWFAENWIFGNLKNFVQLSVPSRLSPQSHNTKSHRDHCNIEINRYSHPALIIQIRTIDVTISKALTHKYLSRCKAENQQWWRLQHLLILLSVSILLMCKHYLNTEKHWRPLLSPGERKILLLLFEKNEVNETLYHKYTALFSLILIWGKANIISRQENWRGRFLRNIRKTNKRSKVLWKKCVWLLRKKRYWPC